MGIKSEKSSMFKSILILATMIVLFIMAISVNGYSASISPTIHTGMHPGPGENIAVTGQNFTLDGIAVLYSINNKSYTTNVDQNGNAVWTYTNDNIIPYQVYAVDLTTNVTSNTETVYPTLNDIPPTIPPTSMPASTPTSTPTPFPGIDGICAIGICIIIHAFKRK